MSGLEVPSVPEVGIGRGARVRSLLRPLSVSAGGLSAFQRAMDTISENIMNVNTTRTPDGGPYRRKVPILERAPDGSVRVTQIVEDTSQGRLVFEPGHPDADENGMVLYPNVELMTETASLMIARRVYEANATAFQAAKAMIRRALEI